MTVRAEVTEVDGGRVVFDVVATDPGGATLARGTVTRAVVDVERFTARLARP